MIERLESMLAAGHDNALLRFSLGNAYLKDDSARAVEHLRRAVEFDPEYSAAWKLLGRALVNNAEPDAAIAAFRRGIDTAERRGDLQAVREMRVFLRRVEKSQGVADQD